MAVQENPTPPFPIWAPVVTHPLNMVWFAKSAPLKDLSAINEVITVVGLGDGEGVTDGVGDGVGVGLGVGVGPAQLLVVNVWGELIFVFPAESVAVNVAV